MPGPLPSGDVVALLTLEDVRLALRLRTVRQVRRLASAPDPLPVLHLNRKALRVHPADLAAWIERRRLGHRRLLGEGRALHLRHTFATARPRAPAPGGLPLPFE